MKTLNLLCVFFIMFISTNTLANIDANSNQDFKSSQNLACVNPNVNELQKQAANVNNEQAILTLANCYVKGSGVLRDTKKAEQLLKKLAATNKPHAQYDLAVFYVKILENYQAAAEYYTKAAEQGFIPAKTNLGVLYADGQGVKQDYTKAVALFREAAMQGDPIAQFWLALAYMYGKGIELDQKKALEWMHEAAENGNSMAQSYLGDMYAMGAAGLSRDYAEANKWYRKSANQGNPLGEYNLGVNYTFGYGVDKDDKTAFGWFLKAAEQGHPPSQYNVGAAYIVGRGSEHNGVKAYMWLTLAAENGFSGKNANPKDMLERLRGFLSSSEIAEGDRLVSEYKNKLEMSKTFIK